MERTTKKAPRKPPARAVKHAPHSAAGKLMAAAPSERLFLTIPEAAVMTGLTQAYLQNAIDEGTLPAIKDVSWKMRRDDLEAIRPEGAGTKTRAAGR